MFIKTIIILFCSNFSMINNIENMCEPIKNNHNHDEVHNNQINSANNNDFSSDVEMENGHNVTNGKFFCGINWLN